MAANKKPKTTNTPGALAAPSEEDLRKEHEGRLWTLLVSEGSVIVNRVNALGASTEKSHAIGPSLGAFAAAALVASVALSLSFGMTAGEAVKGWRVNQAELNRWAGGATWRGTAAAAAGVVKAADYARFVDEVATNPGILVQQADGAAAPGVAPCAPIDSLSEAWAHSASDGALRPRCKFSGDNIFVASFVQDGSTGKDWIYPVLGVFHKEGGRWTYYNFVGAVSGTFALRGKESVSIEQIGHAVHKAFPGALARGDLTAPQTALAWIKKQFTKKN